MELLRLRFHEGLPIREIAARWKRDTAWVPHQYATAREEFKRAVDAGLEVAAKVPPAMAVPRPPQPAPGPRPTPGAGRGSGAGGGAKKNARKSKAKDDSRGWSKGRANGSGAGGSKPRTRAHPQSVSTGAHAAVALLDLRCYEYCC